MKHLLLLLVLTVALLTPALAQDQRCNVGTKVEGFGTGWTIDEAYESAYQSAVTKCGSQYGGIPGFSWLSDTGFTASGFVWMKVKVCCVHTF